MDSTTFLLFSIENINDVVDNLKNGIKAPYVNVAYSTLGGKDRVTILLIISLDKRETWKNGIIENTNYTRLSLNRNGEVHSFSGFKVRKFRAKSIPEVITKINQALDKTRKERNLSEGTQQLKILNGLFKLFR